MLKFANAPISVELLKRQEWTCQLDAKRLQITFSYPADSPELGAMSAYSPEQIRYEFVRLKTPEMAFAFFQEYGPFSRHANAKDKQKPHQVLGKAFTFDLRQLEELRAVYTDAMLASPAEWQSSAPKLLPLLGKFGTVNPSFYLGTGRAGKKPGAPVPTFIRVSHDVGDALASLLLVEKAAGLEGKICDNCGAPFIVNVKHDRRWCGPGCGAHARITASRKLQRAKAEKDVRRTRAKGSK